MKNLTVIGEVFVDINNKGTVNRSVNEILISYARHFNSVHYIGPGDREITMEKGLKDKILISTITDYNKSLKNRLRYYIRYNKVKKRYKDLLKESDIVQIRIPSLFSIGAYPVVKSLKLPLTTYIAGDWLNSFNANYKFRGSKYIANRLERMQHPIIKNSIPVTAGPILADKYSKINKCHAYYSTTHNKVYNKKHIIKPHNIIFVGRLEPLKRVEDAIKSIEILLRRSIDVKLTILGDGFMRKQLENMVGEMKLEEHVLFKGNISDKDIVKEEYLKADILLLPSLSEGTPKVLAEAMAHSVVPIAVEDVGSNDYIIQNGVNGILVPKRSPESIADSIMNLVENIEIYSDMVHYSQKYALEHTLDNEVDKLWDFVFQSIKI